MLKGAGHPGDLGRSGANLLCGVLPGSRYDRDLLDGGARRSKAEAEVAGGRLEEIARAAIVPLVPARAIREAFDAGQGIGRLCQSC